MFSKILSAGIIGVDAYLVDVEVDSVPGIPGFSIVGLPEIAVKESKERVIAALKNLNLYPGPMKITVNLAPADIKKEGTSYDLPILLGVLVNSGIIENSSLLKTLVAGEVTLDGHIRSVKGVLSIGELVKKEEDIDTLIVPFENRMEAGVVEGIKVLPVNHIYELINHLNGTNPLKPYKISIEELYKKVNYSVDFRDVKGQESAKRALEIAAAGGHNMLMIGPPGSGKTMLAKRIPSILPDISIDEALETTRIYSIAGLLDDTNSFISIRPFRAPHHTISDAGLIGGGHIPHPGEVSLAHNGVLFLDELPEFKRNVLEVLRQPLEDGSIRISRAKISVRFPSRFMLVAAMNPCPCGYYGDPFHTCTCTPNQIYKYRAKISGPLMDRIDIHIEVPNVRYEELSDKRRGEYSSTIRERVNKAREIQHERFKRHGLNIFSNAQMGATQIEDFCSIEQEGKRLLKKAMEHFGFSARAYSKILKIARTIADLDEEESIKPHHLSEAIQYRSLDRKGGI